jgi:hypothetical protein
MTSILHLGLSNKNRSSRPRFSLGEILHNTFNNLNREATGDILKEKSGTDRDSIVIAAQTIVERLLHRGYL